MKLKELKRDYRFRLPVDLYDQVFSGTYYKSKLLTSILDNYVKEQDNDKAQKI